MAFSDNDACADDADDADFEDFCDGFLFTVISASGEARLYSIDNVVGDTNDNQACDAGECTFDLVDEQSGDTIEEDASCDPADVVTISGMGDIALDCATDSDVFEFEDIDLANNGDMETSLGGAIDLTYDANTAKFDVIDGNAGADTMTVDDDGSDDMTVTLDAGLAFMDIEEDSDTQIALDAQNWGIIYTNADSTDDNDISIEYSEEVDDDTGVSAMVYAVEGAVGTTTASNVPVTDAAVSTVSAKNLLVVGGSCINTVAANLLTGNAAPLCGNAFSAVTTVGAGQYLIQVLPSPYTTGKVAVLLAGYEADQTRDAVDAFQEGGVAMTAGTKIVGPTLA
jgi:hypothetical protein